MFSSSMADKSVPPEYIQSSFFNYRNDQKQSVNCEKTVIAAVCGVLHITLLRGNIT